VGRWSPCTGPRLSPSGWRCWRSHSHSRISKMLTFTLTSSPGFTFYPAHDYYCQMFYYIASILVFSSFLCIVPNYFNEGRSWRTLVKLKKITLIAPP
jgi:hypothetical protein